MQTDYTPGNGAGASPSSRNFLAIATAGTAATLPATANTEAVRKASKLVLPLSEQLDTCIAQLKTILKQMHPEAKEVGSTKPNMTYNPDGSFFFVLSGRIPSRASAGNGRYIVSMDGYPQLVHLAHRQTYDRSTGNIPSGQDYYSATAIHEDGYVDEPRHRGSPRILRKVEKEREL